MAAKADFAACVLFLSKGEFTQNWTQEAEIKLINK